MVIPAISIYYDTIDIPSVEIEQRDIDWWGVRGKSTYTCRVVGIHWSSMWDDRIENGLQKINWKNHYPYVKRENCTSCPVQKLILDGLRSEIQNKTLKIFV